MGLKIDSVMLRNKETFTLSHVMLERMVGEGEVFVLLITSKDGYPRLQAISPLRVRSSSDSTDKSIDGIWYSSIDEPIAYNIFDRKTQATVNM